MSKKPNRIEIEVPEGKIVVRHAHCPTGCDLMDPDVTIHDHASIHVAFEIEGQKGRIHLDPVYGSHDNISAPEVSKGSVVHFSCPHCGVSLEEEDAICADCSAPMFMLHLPGGNFVEACERNGCGRHRLRIVSGEQMMQRLFDDIGQDSYL